MYFSPYEKYDLYCNGVLVFPNCFVINYALDASFDGNSCYHLSLRYFNLSISGPLPLFLFYNVDITNFKNYWELVSPEKRIPVMIEGAPIIEKYDNKEIISIGVIIKYEDLVIINKNNNSSSSSLYNIKKKTKDSEDPEELIQSRWEILDL